MKPTVLDDTLSTTFPDTGHSSLVDPRFLTIGMSSRRRILVVAHTEHNNTVRIISARRATGHERRFMKKANRKPIDDMLPEYDFASMKGGVRGK